MSARDLNPINQCRAALYQILKEYCAIFNQPSSDRLDDTTSKLIVSNDQTRYLIIDEGWNGNKRVHALIFDAEIRNDKIWLHHDGLDHGITDELIAAGVPKDHIVLAFHPPHVRSHTGYAVA